MASPVVMSDPTGERDGIPSYWWRAAPAGLATLRQLRADGLRPGGQEIAAILLKPRSRVRAHLYRVELAKPKRTASPAQLAATRKATRARRLCGGCGSLCDYIPPKRNGYRGHCCDP